MALKALVFGGRVPHASQDRSHFRAAEAPTLGDPALDALHAFLRVKSFALGDVPVCNDSEMPEGAGGTGLSVVWVVLVDEAVIYLSERSEACEGRKHVEAARSRVSERDVVLSGNEDAFCRSVGDFERFGGSEAEWDEGSIEVLALPVAQCLQVPALSFSEALPLVFVHKASMFQKEEIIH